MLKISIVKATLVVKPKAKTETIKIVRFFYLINYDR